MKKKIFRIFKINKPLLALLSLLLSFFLVVASTYAWYTTADQRINRMKSTKKDLTVRIIETFDENYTWAPGSETIKEVKVRNDGELPALVRLSLHEFLASFAIDLSDQAGNGNLKKETTLTKDEMTQFDRSTWAVGKQLKIKNNTYVTAEEVIKNPTDDHSKAFPYTNLTARGTALANLTVNFEKNKVYHAASLPPAGTTNYWFFENGYFYYSEVLNPNEETTTLVKSVSLSDKTPNRYKGALYQLVPVLDGHQNANSVLDSWKLTSGPVYDMYKSKAGK